MFSTVRSDKPDLVTLAIKGVKINWDPKRNSVFVSTDSGCSFRKLFTFNDCVRITEFSGTTTIVHLGTHGFSVEEFKENEANSIKNDESEPPTKRAKLSDELVKNLLKEIGEELKAIKPFLKQGNIKQVLKNFKELADAIGAPLDAESSSDSEEEEEMTDVSCELGAPDPAQGPQPGEGHQEEQHPPNLDCGFVFDDCFSLKKIFLAKQ